MIEIAPIQTAIEESLKRLNQLSLPLKADEKREKARQIEERMAQPAFWNDQETARKEVDALKSLKTVLDPLNKALKDLHEAQDLLTLGIEENDEPTILEAQFESERLVKETDYIELLTLLSGAHDHEPCFIEIHTGAGGSDACEWAEMLVRMYLKFFEKKGWEAEELDWQNGEESGIRSAQFRVSGEFCYGYLRLEMGVHRLVRISPFSGKRETSFAAVDVIPDIQKEIDIAIEEKDLRIDTYRSSGKGGQHVNKTDSAVRITHIPTGIVVAVQNERSQHKNKDLAMKILKARLYQHEEFLRQNESDARNAQKMDNAWGSQIRNYVMNPYQMVKDARTGCETGDISKILDGNLEDFIDAELRWAVEK